jgi:hypothetical protein
MSHGICSSAVRIALTVTLVACAGSLRAPPSRDAQLAGDWPPELRASATVQLDALRAAPAIAAIAARPDELRILYEREDSHEVRYVVLTSVGGRQRNEALPPDLLPKAGWAHSRFDLDLAFDGDAVLHALVGGRQLALQADGWKAESGPPCESFVRGGPRLVCVGPPSAAYPAKYRWDWTFFPIYPAVPIFIPSRSTLRTVAAYVRQPDGWQAVGIFDSTSELATLALRGVAGANSDIHALFARVGRFSVDWRYEVAPRVADFTSPAASTPGSGRALSVVDATKDANCNPPPGSFDMPTAGSSMGSLAIDETTGRGLVTVIGDMGKVICQRAIAPGTLGEPRVAFAGSNLKGVWIAHLGGERFAMLRAERLAPAATDSVPVRLSFALSTAGRWSRADPVGMFSLGFFMSFGGDAPLVGRGDGRAALVALDEEAHPVVVWFEPGP